jgi:hypothetical protein
VGKCKKLYTFTFLYSFKFFKRYLKLYIAIIIIPTCWACDIQCSMCDNNNTMEEGGNGAVLTQSYYVLPESSQN